MHGPDGIQMALVSAPIASHNRHRRIACAPFVSNQTVAELSHHRTLATSDAASACHLALLAVPRALGSSGAAFDRHPAKHLVLQTPQVFVLRLSLRGQREQRLPVPACLILQLPAPPCWQNFECPPVSSTIQVATKIGHNKASSGVAHSSVDIGTRC